MHWTEYSEKAPSVSVCHNTHMSFANKGGLHIYFNTECTNNLFRICLAVNRIACRKNVFPCGIHDIMGIDDLVLIAGVQDEELYFLWSPLKTIVPQMRSQIFRQIVQKFRRQAGACQEISVQDDGKYASR